MSEDAICSPLERAMYDVVHDYPRGAVALCTVLDEQLGITAGTLSNKVNWKIKTHFLGIKEAVEIQRRTMDFRILHAEALALNHAVIYLGELGNSSDVELLNAYANFHSSIGETSAEIHRALEDSRITEKELIRIRVAGRASVQAYLELEQRLEAICDDS